MKKRKVLLLLLIIILTQSGVYFLYSINKTEVKNDYSYLENSSKKIVLFIGDGMGFNHIKVTKDFYNKEFVYESFANKGAVKTFSKAILVPTDSAAAATAMATGYKVNNKEISRTNGQDIENIAETLKKKGKGIGIVTTDSLYGATPSAFSSHSDSRDDVDTIVCNQLISNIDIFLGAGKTTYDNYLDLINDNDYLYISDYSMLDNSYSKILGSFTSINNYTFNNKTPTLEALASFAINFLENKYPNGYFLMIEGAHIDKESHNNNIFSMMNYLDEFSTTIKDIFNKVSPNNDTSIIVTADHETGNLLYQDGQPITNELFTKTGHSNRDVPYYIYINNIEKQVHLPTTIDNTDIYQICKYLIK